MTITPVFYYTFDTGLVDPVTAHTATDSGGAGNTGTLTNYSSSGDVVTGQVNQGLQFNGSNQRVELAVIPSSGKISMMAWVKTTSLSNFQTVLGKWFDSPTYGYFMYLDQTTGQVKIAYRTTGGSSDRTFSTGINLSTNTWYHVACTFSAGYWKFYLNGQLRKMERAVDSGGLQNSNGPLGVGAVRSNGSWTNFFTGVIDEARIYDGEISAKDIASFYAAGKLSVMYVGKSVSAAFTSSTQTVTLDTGDPDGGLFSGFLAARLQNAQTISSITVDGVTATIDQNITGITSPQTRNVALFHATVSAQTGGHVIVVTWSLGTGSVDTRFIGFVLNGQATSTPFASSASSNTVSQSSPATQTVNTPGDGVSLFCAVDTDSTETTTWSPAQYLADYGNSFTNHLSVAIRWSASAETPHSETVTNSGESFALLATSYDVLTNTTENATEATLTYTGQDATDSYTITDTAVEASITFTGTNATETFSETVAVATITLTGEVATEVYLISEQATEASITYTGQDATDTIGTVDITVEATLTFTGQSASETLSEVVIYASITFTGQDAEEITGYQDFADAADLLFEGQGATETYSGVGVPTAQMTQQQVLVLAEGTPVIRVTQQQILVLAEGDHRGRTTQMAVLVLASVRSAALSANEGTQIITSF